MAGRLHAAGRLRAAPKPCGARSPAALYRGRRDPAVVADGRLASVVVECTVPPRAGSASNLCSAAPRLDETSPRN